MVVTFDIVALAAVGWFLLCGFVSGACLAIWRGQARQADLERVFALRDAKQAEERVTYERGRRTNAEERCRHLARMARRRSKEIQRRTKHDAVRRLRLAGLVERVERLVG